MRCAKVLTVELLLVIVCLAGVLSVSGQVAAPTVTTTDPTKLAILKALEEYFNQFSDACFAKERTFSLGEKDLYARALERQIGKIIFGVAGEKYIKDMGSDAIALHHSWNIDVIEFNANIALRFDPTNLAPLPRDYRNRQTLAHEITHHMEFLEGVKESSTGNPRAERNTEYQDHIVDLLWQLYVIEDPTRIARVPIRQKTDIKPAVKVLRPKSMGDKIFHWQNIESDIAAFLKGSAAGGNPPDYILNHTGFNVDLPNITQRYAAGLCGPEMLALVRMSPLLPDLNPNLQFEDTDTAAGVRVKAVLETRSGTEIKVPAYLRPRVVWKLPGGRSFTGNPVKLTRGSTDQQIPTELVVTFNQRNYVIGKASYTLAVTSPETSVKRHGVIGKYRGRFSGDLEGAFEFTVQESSSPSKLIKAVEGKLSPIERQIVLGWTTETAPGEFEIRATITNADGSSSPSSNFFTGKIRPDGTATGEWHIFDFPGKEAPESKHGRWTTAETKLNLALNRPAAQSSRSPWSKPNDPQGAVDGVKNGSFGFHTDEEVNPWWEVDLGEVKALFEIQIFNRTDHNPERSRTLQVYVSNDGKSWRKVFDNKGVVFGGVGTKPLVINVVGSSARYVRLQLTEKTWFHLDEIEIY